MSSSHTIIKEEKKVTTQQQTQPVQMSMPILTTGGNGNTQQPVITKTEKTIQNPDGSVTKIVEEKKNSNGQLDENDPEVKMQLEKQKREKGV